MPKKITPSVQIREGAKELKDLMYSGLEGIANEMISQISSRMKRLIPSERLNAIKDLETPGLMAYKANLLEALSLLAMDAINQARKEVPKAKNVKLTEFDKLPAALQKKLKSRNDLLVGKQIGDLQKVIEFAYISNEDTTDSDALVTQDLHDSAIGWLDGTSLSSGADITAATVISDARDAFFFDFDVLEEIEAFEFVNGDPVTPICQDLAGTIFAKDDAEMFRYTPPLHWNAVLSGTKISTSNGDKPIEEIILGEKVLTHTGKYKSVTEVMSKFEDKEYYEVELENGKIVSITGEHPVLTEKGWLRTDELIVGDDVVCIEDIQNE